MRNTLIELISIMGYYFLTIFIILFSIYKKSLLVLLLTIFFVILLFVLYKKNRTNADVIKRHLIVLIIFIGLGIILNKIISKYFATLNYYTQVCVILIICIACSTFLLLKPFFFNTKERIFVVWSALFGIILMILLPIKAVPDELVHINTAYHFSSQLLGETKYSDESFQMRETDATVLEDNYEFQYDLTLANDYYSKIKYDTNYGESRTIRADTLLIGNDIAYYISAIAISICKLINLNGFITLLSGRIVNFCIYLILGYFSVKNFPYNKLLPMFILLLPMSLQQGMSYSYDWLVISSTVFVISNSLYLDKNGFEKHKLLSIIVALFSLCLFSLKSHAYFMVSIFPIVLYLSKKIDMNKVMKKIFFLCIALTLVFCVYAIFDQILNIPDIVYEPENLISWVGGEQGYTIQYFINHPWNFIYSFLSTMKNYGMYYFESMLCSPLGWLNISFSGIYSKVFFILLVYAGLNQNNESVSKGIQVYAFIATVITILGIVIALYISWTPLSSPVALGVQGRYFLPILFMLLLVLNRIHIKINIDSLCIVFEYFTLVVFFIDFMLKI